MPEASGMLFQLVQAFPEEGTHTQAVCNKNLAINRFKSKTPTSRSQWGFTETKSIKPTWESLLCMDLPQVDQHSAFRIGQVLYMEDTSCRFDPI